MVLLGGAPGVGKSAVATEFLRLAEGGGELVQWVDVDALWSHQPWRVDAAMISMVQANLRAVIGNAAMAGVELLLVTWVFQETSFHELLRELAPDGVKVTTVQLLAGETTWRERWAADDSRPPIGEFFEDRYRAAQATPADFAVATDGVDAVTAARAVAAHVGLGPVAEG
ncbi:hypothetical protein Pen01_43770 [Phytomonospora endophytica]|nr:hypothetical protein Pen01_43770 [Phytomonospora endophytica]